MDQSESDSEQYYFTESIKLLQAYFKQLTSPEPKPYDYSEDRGEHLRSQ